MHWICVLFLVFCVSQAIRNVLWAIWFQSEEPYISKFFLVNQLHTTCLISFTRKCWSLRTSRDCDGDKSWSCADRSKRLCIICWISVSSSLRWRRWISLFIFLGLSSFKSSLSLQQQYSSGKNIRTRRVHLHASLYSNSRSEGQLQVRRSKKCRSILRWIIQLRNFAVERHYPNKCPFGNKCRKGSRQVQETHSSINHMHCVKTPGPITQAQEHKTHLKLQEGVFSWLLIYTILFSLSKQNRELMEPHSESSST